MQFRRYQNPKINILFVFLASLIISGCATSARYPDYQRTATLSPSTETISTMNAPAGAYQIPESQILVSGSSNNSGGTGALAFGLIGTMIAMNVDASNNSAAVGEHAEKLKLKFHQSLQESLEKKIAEENLSSKYKVMPADSAADIKLMPMSDLRVISDGKVSPIFGLIATFKEDSGSEVSKTYTYRGSDVLSFSEWSSQNGKPVQTAAQLAFEKLSSIFVKDVSGQFKSQLTAEKKTLTKWEVKNEYKKQVGVDVASVASQTSVVLQDSPNLLVLAPMRGDKVWEREILVFEKSLIQIN